MSLVEFIDTHTDTAQNTKYEIKEIDFLPSNHNMSGRKAYKVDVCALYIELRGANTLEISDWESSIQLIHQQAIDSIYEILKEYNGQIMVTPGNGILALWPANKANINQAVEAALTINWLFQIKYQSKSDHPRFDYGIALHHGPALAVKNQKPGGEFDEEEIKYISPVINITQSMSNQLSKPHCIGISHDVYDRLYDESITVKKSFVIIPYQKNIWQDDKAKYNDKTVKIKTTGHYLNFETKSIES